MNDRAQVHHFLDPFVLVATLVLGTITVVFFAPVPNEAELQAAADTTVTPCYYFCGPWYTWLFTWLAAIVVVALLAGLIQRWRVRRRAA